MISAGIIRELSKVGRVVIPFEFRKVLNIAEKDELEIFVDGNTVILMKYRQACVFCEKTTIDASNFKGKNICSNCIKELKDSGKNKVVDKV